MSDHQSSPDVTGVAVVVLVASSGGVYALGAVLRQLPKDLAAPVVVQQHLGTHGSQFVNVLQRQTGLPVAWALDGELLKPGQVVVTPPRRRLEILPDGSTAVGAALLDIRERPHDLLLTSLADSYGPRALAVVLTGMGVDGAGGVRAMKAAGGLVIAQSEESAEQPSMPRAAIEAGADLVLPLEQIPAVIGDVVNGAPLPPANEELAAIRATFGDQGQVARLAGEIDWSRTPVGRVCDWSPVLRTAVRLAQDSPDPTAVMWGEDYFLMFNEAAVAPLNGRYAAAFARPQREGFPELWERISPLYAETMRGGRPRMEAAHLPFERAGRMQDAWFDVSLTPIRTTDGEVAGIYQSFFDRTQEVLAGRRMHVLNRLAAIPVAVDRRAAAEAALAVLGDSADVLFSMAYLVGVTGLRAGLVGATGVAAGGPLAVRDARLTPHGVWPLREVADGARVLLEDLGTRFRGHLLGAEELAPEAALLHPLRDMGEDKVVGILILGANPQLPLDDRYREFLALVAETVTAKVAESDARRRERERLDRLAELDRAKTEFFSNISHEFRTPLTLMLAPLEQVLQQASELPPGVAAELEIAERNTRRLLRLVGTLLDFSQLGAGRMRARFAPADLAALTVEIVSMFRSAADAAGLRLTVDAPTLPRPVWVDAEMWEKIVSNLVSNALKFTWAGGVDVTLRALTGHAELTVRDTGVGIPAGQLPHIFTRFHRVSRTRGRTHEGAGIGLALVDELVRRHHGRVRAVSQVDHGSAFTVWLPLSRRPAQDGEQAPPPIGPVASAMAAEAVRWDAAREQSQRDLRLDSDPQLPPLPGRRLTGGQVLVVDDNADMREYLARLLGGTWQVTGAADGVHALEILRDWTPDLVLADVMMPRLDGFELLRRVRDDARLATLPVVLLTARAGEEAAIEGLLAGADDYVVKPFSARELVARVAAQIELARQRRRTEARWKAIVDAGFDVVYRMSPDWSQMRTLTGRGFLDDTAEPTDSWLDHYIDPPDQPRVLAAIDEAVRTRTIFQLEHRVRRPDGSIGLTLSRAVPLLDENGEIEEWVGTATNLSGVPPEPDA
ncbi:chemotaxis protein CheB [Paractinoplanes lichenicola]|uniref:histidine kinase n=1 Tax=Paractinoplanes lichenicola TaxID=2802976 RepID=A0ABS1VYK3_9ACTN|nr:chemotaxis protein CheB [Actinoplanes lichenicola]MBL7259524.1 response regulator [Actinoplanes lichenicola]